MFCGCSEWMGWFGYHRFSKLPFTISEDLCKKCKINEIIGTVNKQMMLIVFNVTYMSGLGKVFSNIDFVCERTQVKTCSVPN